MPTAWGSAAGRHARVSEPDEPEALPGLRQTVRASRAVSAKRKAVKTAAAAPAAVDPVARVLVDVPLAHLDRPFDYLVPAAMADDAVPGTRVKVRFAGQEVGGYLLARGERVRPRRAAHAAAPGRQRRAGAHPGRGGAGRRRGRPLRRLAQRRAASRRATAARRHRAGRAGPGRRPSAVRPRLGGRRVGRAPAGRGVPAPAGRGGVAEGRLGDPTGDGLADAARPRGRGDVRRLGTWRPAVRARRQGRGPRRRRADRGARDRPARDPDGAAGPRPEVPRLPGRLARRTPGRGRHPGGGLRARARPGTGGDLGRR